MQLHSYVSRTLEILGRSTAREIATHLTANGYQISARSARQCLESLPQVVKARGGTFEIKKQGGARPARRGVSFERDVKRWLEGLGYFVVRSAGSRGPADHAALRAPDVRLLVQVKTNGRLPRAERDVLLAAADVAGATPVLVDRPARGVKRARLVGHDGSLIELDLA